MRVTTATLGVLAMALVTGSALAAGGGTSGQQQGKGSAESRGGSGPGQGGTAQEGSDIGSVGGPSEGNADVLHNEEAPKKPWEVGGVWETHRVIRQAQSAGAGKQFNVFGLSGKYNLTEYDTVRVRMFLFERFLADPGETGFRFDDIILAYTRRVPLPEKFTVRATASATAPTSFSSQLAGVITSPRLSLDLEKKLGKYVVVSGRTSGDATIARYRTSAAASDPASGGNPNPKYGWRFGADLEVVMPFHEPLSFGATAATGYTWFYEPNSTADANPSAQANGTVGDSTFKTQPILQSYSGEIFARYTLPPLAGMRSDIVVAAANGDPSLGGVSVLHDGVGRFYLAYRQTAEVYGVLTLRY